MAVASASHYGHDSSHPLIEIDDDDIPSHPHEFFCAGCKSTGHGKRLHCSQCNFTLHPFCATCPTELTSFTHSAHPLHLHFSPPTTLPPGVNYICDICSDVINGAHYLCSPCDFGFHPCCSQIPRYVNSPALDSTHPLELQTPTPGKICDVCKDDCNLQYWWYRCLSCDVDAHSWCVNGTQKPRAHQPSQVGVDDSADALAAAQVAAYFSRRGRDASLALLSNDEYRYVYKRRDDYI